MNNNAASKFRFSPLFSVVFFGGLVTSIVLSPLWLGLMVVEKLTKK